MRNDFLLSLLQATAADGIDIQLCDEAAIRFHGDDKLVSATYAVANDPAVAADALAKAVHVMRLPGFAAARSQGAFPDGHVMEVVDVAERQLVNLGVRDAGSSLSAVDVRHTIRFRKADDVPPIPRGVSAVDLPVAVAQFVHRLGNEPDLDTWPLERAAEIDANCFRETAVPDRRAFIASLGERYRRSNLPSPTVDSPLGQALQSLREDPALEITQPPLHELFAVNDPHLRQAIDHEMRRGSPEGAAVLTPVLVDDWLIFARDREGNAYSVVTEMWSDWLELPEGAESEKGAVKRYMLPVAWHKGYFHNLQWWEEVAPDFDLETGLAVVGNDGLPQTTIDGAPPYWEEAPLLQLPPKREQCVEDVGSRQTVEIEESTTDGPTGEERLLRAIFGHKAPDASAVVNYSQQGQPPLQGAKQSEDSARAMLARLGAHIQRYGSLNERELDDLGYTFHRGDDFTGGERSLRNVVPFTDRHVQRLSTDRPSIEL